MIVIITRISSSGPFFPLLDKLVLKSSRIAKISPCEETVDWITLLGFKSVVGISSMVNVIFPMSNFLTNISYDFCNEHLKLLLDFHHASQYQYLDVYKYIY